MKKFWILWLCGYTLWLPSMASAGRESHGILPGFFCSGRTAQGQFVSLDLSILGNSIPLGTLNIEPNFSNPIACTERELRPPGAIQIFDCATESEPQYQIQLILSETSASAYVRTVGRGSILGAPTVLTCE